MTDAQETLGDLAEQTEWLNRLIGVKPAPLPRPPPAAPLPAAAQPDAPDMQDALAALDARLARIERALLAQPPGAQMAVVAVLPGGCLIWCVS